MEGLAALLIAFSVAWAFTVMLSSAVSRFLDTLGESE